MLYILPDERRGDFRKILSQFQYYSTRIRRAAGKDPVPGLISPYLVLEFPVAGGGTDFSRSVRDVLCVSAGSKDLLIDDRIRIIKTSEGGDSRNKKLIYRRFSFWMLFHQMLWR